MSSLAPQPDGPVPAPAPDPVRVSTPDSTAPDSVAGTPPLGVASVAAVPAAVPSVAAPLGLTPAPVAVGLPRPASDAAAAITRGVRRMLAERGVRGLVEFPLANGRRADILALADDGEVTIVEVKSGPVDFKTDQKWPEYLEFCDRFYFAVDADFPQELIPADCGLMIADAFGAEILRPAPLARLAGARRKVLTLRVAQTAMARLHRVEDPGQGW